MVKTIFFIIMLMICSLIPFTSAFNITTDDISTTSITWNLSEKGELSIQEIVIDGSILSDYSPNATRIVQSNLKPDEQHYIQVMDSNFEFSELSATTLPDVSEQENFFSTINIWILIILALVFLISAVALNMGFLAFIGTVFCIAGIVASVGNSFTTGLIFLIMTLATIFVGFSSIRD